MSLEDLRDQYKCSRQSKDIELKLNGATCRKLIWPSKQSFRTDAATKWPEMQRNRIYITEINRKGNLLDDSVLNSFKMTSTTDDGFTMDKKNRWKLIETLKAEQTQIAEKTIDIHLYETRNRVHKKARLTEIRRTKDEPIEVKITNADLRTVWNVSRFQYFLRVNIFLNV